MELTLSDLIVLGKLIYRGEIQPDIVLYVRELTFEGKDKINYSIGEREDFDKLITFGTLVALPPGCKYIRRMENIDCFDDYLRKENYEIHNLPFDKFGVLEEDEDLDESEWERGHPLTPHMEAVQYDMVIFDTLEEALEHLKKITGNRNFLWGRDSRSQIWFPIDIIER